MLTRGGRAGTLAVTQIAAAGPLHGREVGWKGKYSPLYSLPTKRAKREALPHCLPCTGTGKGEPHPFKYSALHWRFEMRPSGYRRCREEGGSLSRILPSLSHFHSHSPPLPLPLPPSLCVYNKEEQVFCASKIGHFWAIDSTSNSLIVQLTLATYLTTGKSVLKETSKMFDKIAWGMQNPARSEWARKYPARWVLMPCRDARDQFESNSDIPVL
jgi:hypothetical protein